MVSKTTLLVGLATGYVLGTRDGRERYEQIKDQATKVWKDPRVQKKAEQAQDLAKDKAPMVKDKVAGAAHKATDKAKSKASSSDSSDVVVETPVIVTPDTVEPVLSTPSERPTPGGLHG